MPVAASWRRTSKVVDVTFDTRVTTGDVLLLYRIEQTTVRFRARFELAKPPEDAVLTIAALRGYRLEVNGVDLTPEPPTPWNQPDRVPPPSVESRKRILTTWLFQSDRSAT